MMEKCAVCGEEGTPWHYEELLGHLCQSCAMDLHKLVEYPEILVIGVCPRCIHFGKSELCKSCAAYLNERLSRCAYTRLGMK